MTKLTADDIARGLQRLPSLPALVEELLQSIDMEDADVKGMAERLAKDQALAAKALRVANSSFYGLAQRVVTIQDAVIVLGLRTVRSLITTAAVMNAFPDSEQHKAFWHHALGTALCARVLARRAGVDENSAFTAGLLHDIGRLALATCFAKEFAQVASMRDQNDCHLIEAERIVLGVDHTQAGTVLAERWNFAPPIRHAIAEHHAVDDGNVERLSALTHVADAMAHALGLGHGENDLVPRLSSVAWNSLRIGWDQFKQALGEVERMSRDSSLLLAN